MGLKYYLPENHENLAGCEGYYIDNEAFFGKNTPDTEIWDKSVKELALKLKRFIPGMAVVNEWENNMGIQRYILLKSALFQIVMGDDERYVSIFLIIPESCDNEERAMEKFHETLKTMRGYLMRKFPNSLYKRKNTWNLESVTEETDNAGGVKRHVRRTALLH